MAAGWAAVVEPFWRSAAGMGLAQALQQRLEPNGILLAPILILIVLPVMIDLFSLRKSDDLRNAQPEVPAE